MSNHTNGAMFETQYRKPLSSNDYRQIVVTRNWFESVVSGYLYHKTGRECWLDWFGHSGHKGWLLNNTSEDWEVRLQHFRTSKSLDFNWVAGRGRDLCQYLSEEPEIEGLKVYTAWALSSYLDPLLRFRQQRIEREKRKGWNRTKFLCYEQFMSTPTKSMNDTFEWLFPRTYPNLNLAALANDSSYQEGHATNQDPKLRSRLLQIVARIDAEAFNNSVARGTLEFRCGM
jgi:hypothetical protein